MLATSNDGVQLKKRGFNMRVISWRSPSISPYMQGRVADEMFVELHVTAGADEHCWPRHQTDG